MAYVKNIWVDQDVERPKTYEVTNNQDGSITLTDSFGLVTELGTPVNAVNMNHIEDGIAQTYVDLADKTLSNVNSIDSNSAVKTALDGKANINLANVNNSGTSRGASWAMPSTTNVELTLGASGATYTAPANGWFTLRLTSKGGTGEAWVIVSSSASALSVRDSNYHTNTTTELGLYCSIPVKAGNVISISYATMPTVVARVLRFIYAEGSKSEAN